MIVQIITWSHVDLVFKKNLTELGAEVIVNRYTHSSRWNSNRRSYFLEFLNLIFFIFNAWIRGHGKTKVFFGHHLTRLFYFLPSVGKSFYVYNELPRLTGLLSVFDKLIFLNARNVFVSSSPRKKLLSRWGFNVDSVGVLENCTVSLIPAVVRAREETPRISYSGTISSKRFHKNARLVFDRMRERRVDLKIWSHYVEDGLENWVGKFEVSTLGESDCVIAEMSHSNVGLLVYAQHSPNDLYAAPLKIYEYVACGMKVAWLGANPGLFELSQQFPSLFVPEDKLFEPIIFDAAYFEARERFLLNGMDSNLEFAKKVVKADY